jgi:hypothetical protein
MSGRPVRIAVQGRFATGRARPIPSDGSGAERARRGSSSTGGGRFAVALLAVSLLLTGCAGGGRLEFASLDFRAVDPPPPRVSPVGLQECYWWTEDDGRVQIAMQSRRTPLWNSTLRFQLQLSLTLEKLPAGPARNYTLEPRALQARVRFGPWESRFTSQTGIVALYRESGDRLRGSARVRTSRVTLQWLGGWSEPVRYLMLASFTAVPDERRGRAIAELATED